MLLRRPGTVTYMLDTASAKGKIVHVIGIKKYKERECERIAKITTVLEEDKEGDDIVDTNVKMKVIGGGVQGSRQKDIEKIRKEFGDKLTEVPGDTHLVEFTINTGEAEPVVQRPYMTALGLREGVEEN